MLNIFKVIEIESNSLHVPTGYKPPIAKKRMLWGKRRV
jgi:hypothetical protein